MRLPSSIPLLIALALPLFMSASGCDLLWSDSGPGTDDLEPIPALDSLDYAQVRPAVDYAYWELRFSFGLEPTPPEPLFEIIGAAGSVDRDDLDPTVLTVLDTTHAQTGFDAECLPSYCYKYVASVRQDGTVEVWATPDSLRAFLGPIDTAEDAILLVAAEGYNWIPGNESGAYRPVDDGFEFNVLKLVKDCDPVQTNRFRLHLATDGTLTIRSESVWESTPGVCI